MLLWKDWNPIPQKALISNVFVLFLKLKCLIDNFCESIKRRVHVHYCTHCCKENVWILLIMGEIE